MNQTKKRLSIINLAISITDIETIQLQISKLRLLKADVKIQDIISVLDEESYAKAQGLIAVYIDDPIEEVLQRASQDVAPIISKKDQAIIDEFDLFVASDTEKEIELTTVDIDISEPEEETTQIPQKTHTIDFNSLLNLDPKDILTDNIELNISNSNQDTFFEADTIKSEPTILDTTQIPKDTFFDAKESTLPKITRVAKKEEPLAINKEESLVKKEALDTPLPTPKPKKIKEPSHYTAMPDIEQKLVNLKKQYASVQTSNETFSTVKELLSKITKEGYSEKELEETFSYIQKLTEKNKVAEATQLLFVSASTKSRFAQLMLARELFKGILVQKNIPEAFEIMKALAGEDYPEALCDLGQFYENAIGTTQNKIKAEELYKQANDAGIKRAKKHYTRLKKQNRSFF